MTEPSIWNAEGQPQPPLVTPSPLDDGRTTDTAVTGTSTVPETNTSVPGNPKEIDEPED